MSKLDDINKELNGLRILVEEAEVTTINIIIISLIWKVCSGRKYSELAEALGMENDRTLQDLRNGLCNGESYNVINKTVAEKIGMRLGMPARVFLGEEGILFKDLQGEVSLKDLVLYRRLLRLKGHGQHRQYLIQQGILDGLLEINEYNAILAELQQPDSKLKITNTKLANVKRRIESVLKRHWDAVTSDKARGNLYYARLLYYFKYEFHSAGDEEQFVSIIENMNLWKPDRLMGMDKKLLERYLKVLRHQVSYVQTTLYLREDERKEK